MTEAQQRALTFILHNEPVEDVTLMMYVGVQWRRTVRSLEAEQLVRNTRRGWVTIGKSEVTQPAMQRSTARRPAIAVSAPVVASAVEAAEDCVHANIENVREWPAMGGFIGECVECKSTVSFVDGAKATYSDGRCVGGLL